LIETPHSAHAWLNWPWVVVGDDDPVGGTGVLVHVGIGLSLGKGSSCARLLPVDAGKKAITVARIKIAIPAMVFNARPNIRMAIASR